LCSALPLLSRNILIGSSDDHIFTSNQTGNSVLLGVFALSAGPSFLDLRDSKLVGAIKKNQTLPLTSNAVALSLSCFILGGFIAGRLGAYFGVRKRGWLVASSAIQTLCVIIATILRSLIHHDEATRSPTGYAIVALLGLAFGGQVALARTVDVPEIATAMLTSAYIDVLIDPELFCRRNRGRNRRLSLILGLIAGSFVGACAWKTAKWVPYLLCATGKAGVTLAFCFNGRQACECEAECQWNGRFEDGYKSDEV